MSTPHTLTVGEPPHAPARWSVGPIFRHDVAWLLYRCDLDAWTPSGAWTQADRIALIAEADEELEYLRHWSERRERARECGL